MKADQRLWTREEVLLVLNLYAKLPFGKMYARHPAVKELAELTDRTPGSVAYKLVNLASLDPSLQQRGIKGASNVSKLDRAVWDEFYQRWDEVLLESEQLLASKKHTTVAALNEVEIPKIIPPGLEKERLVKTRVNQSLFRKMVLAAYDNTCCITGISEPALLVASHISPWSEDPLNRLNPSNGLCLNALHDNAFDRGFLTVDAATLVVRVSSSLKKAEKGSFMESTFLHVEGQPIRLPGKAMPSVEHLKKHNAFFKP